MTNPRITVDPDGLDDFYATDVTMVHFEALDQSRWYATIELADGRIFQLYFGATNPKAGGYADIEQIQVVDVEIYCGSISLTRRDCTLIDGHDGLHVARDGEKWA